MKREQQTMQVEFEQISTEELDEMLKAQLQSEASDPDVITAILAVLQDREKNMPLTLTENEKAAWRKYLSRRELVSAKPAKRYAWVLRAACIVAILSVGLVVFSARADADGFWNRVARWTDSVIEFFDPGYSGGMSQEYIFQTDHPGLQQVYDAVVQMGVKQPVVPMWIPEGSELVQCRQLNNERKLTLMVGFRNGEKKILYNVDVFLEEVANQYQKGDTELKTIEIKGVKFHVVKNYDVWTVVWTVENIECSIATDCQEDELHRILHSIYDKEEAK